MINCAWELGIYNRRDCELYNISNMWLIKISSGEFEKKIVSNFMTFVCKQNDSLEWEYTYCSKKLMKTFAIDSKC